MFAKYIVICRNDRKDDGSKGEYYLATRTAFPDEVSAKSYAYGISPSREPIVVEGNFDELRPPKTPPQDEDDWWNSTTA